MSNIFLSHAEMAYEITQVVGVFDNLDDAVQRCKDRPSQFKNGDGRYDRHWVEEWELAGSFLRQFDLIEGKVVEQRSAAEAHLNGE